MQRREHHLWGTSLPPAPAWFLALQQRAPRHLCLAPPGLGSPPEAAGVGGKNRPGNSDAAPFSLLR